MSKQSALRVVNPLLLLAWAIQAVTGILLKAGSMSFDTFRVVHPYVGYAVVLFGLIHLILNWSWVKSVLFGVKPKKA